MEKVNILNNKLFSLNSTVLNFFLNDNFGFSFFSVNKFSERSEIFSSYLFSKFSTPQLISFLNLMANIVIKKKSLKDRYLLNIFFLDLISSYRGWRHSKGLPVRGQRTWSNAWSTYKSNLTLREYKILLMKRLHGNFSVNEVNIANLAEQINLLWKLQWEHEWREAKKKRLSAMKKKSSIFKIDLYSMSQGLVGDYSKKIKKTKKQKSLKKNYFTLGFDPGFTKALLKNSAAKSKKVSSNKVVVSFNDLDSKAKKGKLKKKKK